MPAANVIALTGLEEDPSDTLSRTQYQTLIETPIAEWCRRYAAHDRILYLVLTKGIPLRIQGAAGPRGTVASVDSELTLLHRKLSGRTVLAEGTVDSSYFLDAAPIDGADRFTHAQFDIFLVSRLDGFTVDDVLSMIDRGSSPVRDGRFVLAQSLTAAGRVDEAHTVTTALLALAPESADAQVQMATIQLRRGDRPPARQSFEWALEYDPGSIDALTGLVTLDAGRDRSADARARLAAKIQARPDDAALLVLAGRTYVTDGDMASGERVLKEAIRVDPSHLEAYRVLGQIYVGEGRLDAAIEQYQALVGVQTSDVSAQTMVAKLSQVLGNVDDARQRYETVLGLDPNAGEAANNLA